MLWAAASSIGGACVIEPEKTQAKGRSQLGPRVWGGGGGEEGKNERAAWRMSHTDRFSFAPTATGHQEKRFGGKLGRFSAWQAWEVRFLVRGSSVAPA